MILAFFLQNKDIKKLFKAGNKALQLVDQWLIANRLSVNVSRTKYILFTIAQSILITKSKLSYCENIKLNKLCV